MKMGWRGALGIGLSAALLVWALHDVAFGKVIDVLRHSNLFLFVLSAAAATAIFPMRAKRWQIILDPVAAGLPVAPLWRSVAIGMMVNNVAPARLGELARAYALTKETPRVRFTAAFGSLALDRACDAIVLMLLMVAAMLAPGFPRDTMISGQPAIRFAIVFAGFGAALVLALYGIVFFPRHVDGCYRAVARRIVPRFEERGSALLHAFTSGLGVLRDPRRLAAVAWWTLLHWLCNGLAFWIGFKAVGIDAPFDAALFLQGLIAIGVAAPSSPGFFGVFEFAARLGLAVYGIDATRALSWALGFHLLSFLPITLIGAYYFARLGLHFRDLKGPPVEAT
jgi:uncharacterized protein (TIRG00374 family)